jgi:hypothetical protein
LDFTVQEVVKNNRSAPVTAGQDITITRPGGLLTINGRHVYAVSEAFPLFHLGQEALLYLRSLSSVGTYSLPYPTGFLLSGENALPLDKILFGQFEGMKKGAVLDLAREAARGCPIPISQQQESGGCPISPSFGEVGLNITAATSPLTSSRTGS